MSEASRPWAEQGAASMTPGCPSPASAPPGVPPVPPPRQSRWRHGCLMAFLALAAAAVLLSAAFVVGIAVGVGSHDGLLSGGGSRVHQEHLSGSPMAAVTVAVVDVKGLITSGQYYDGANAVSICDALRAAAADDSVRAIVLHMDTPGGEITASDEIHQAIVRLRQEKGVPVVTCMGALGASGGYYIAAASDWIVANRLTFTGSIGVIIPGLNYAGLFEKIGLRSESYQSGAMKDMLSGGRERSRAEKDYANLLVQEAFTEFAKVVADGRAKRFGGQVERVRAETFADGRVLSGAMAKECGLVDELGYFDDAQKKAQQLAGISGAKVVRFSRSFSLFERLFATQKELRLQGSTVPVPENWRRVKFGQPYYLMPACLP